MSKLIPATSMPFDADDNDLLGRWHRERGFGSSPAGKSISKWWLAPINHDGRFEAYPYNTTRRMRSR